MHRWSQIGWPPQGQRVPLIGGDGAESFGRGGHVQRLVRADGVVLHPPALNDFLRFVEVGERAVVFQQVGLDALVPTLDLAGRGR